MYSKYLEATASNVNADKYAFVNEAGFNEELEDKGIGTVSNYNKTGDVISFRYASSGKNSVYDMTFTSSGKATAALVGENGASAFTKYTITYNANGGTGTMESTIVTAGNSVNLSTNSFTNAGYDFAGWKDASNNEYADGASVSPTGNLVLTAQWTAAGIVLTKVTNTGVSGISLWDEVAIGDEHFYVVKLGSGTPPSTVTLLAKYNLVKPNGNANQTWSQHEPTSSETEKSDKYQTCAFSSTYYWGGSSNINLNSRSMPASQTILNNAVLRARAYAAQFGEEAVVTGRLLTKNEAATSGEGALFANHSTELSVTDFWLGVSVDEDDVYGVYNGSRFYNWGTADSMFGVRPVLEISNYSISQ